jgi:hypothetical protein
MKSILSSTYFPFCNGKQLCLLINQLIDSTNLRILFTLDSNRSTRFAVLSIHHHQEHIIVYTSLVYSVHFLQHSVRLILQMV